MRVLGFILGNSNVVASGHKKLYSSPFTNSISVSLQMLWPSTHHGKTCNKLNSNEHKHNVRLSKYIRPANGSGVWSLHLRHLRVTGATAQGDGGVNVSGGWSLRSRQLRVTGATTQGDGGVNVSGDWSLRSRQLRVTGAELRPN